MKTKLDLEKFLNQIFIFNSMTPDEIKVLSVQCSVHRVKKDEILFFQDQPATAFFAIAFGKLEIYCVNRAGKEQTLHFHSDQDIVAEAALFGSSKYPASCRALSDSLLVRIPREAFLNLINSSPDISIKIIAAYARRLREFVTMIEYLSLDDIFLRVLKFFYRKAQFQNNQYRVQLKVSKKELASYLGTTPETLSRTLNRLKTEKIITELTRQSFLIHDIEHVESLLNN